MKTCFLIILAAFVYTLPLQAQSSLAGTFDVQWNDMLMAMTSAERSRYDSLPENARTRARQSFETRTFTFSADGSLQVEWRGTDPGTMHVTTGTWQTGTPGILTLTVEGQPHEYTFTLDAGRLVLVKPQPARRGIFTTLVMTRKN